MVGLPWQSWLARLPGGGQFIGRAELIFSQRWSDTLPLRFAAAGLAWGLGLVAIVAWRRNWLGAWAPLSVTLLELCVLFFVGPVEWGRHVPLIEVSPVLRHLASLPAAGLVGGRLLNLPMDVGQTIAYPYLGITPPPPNYLLEAATSPPGKNDDVERRWQRRFGVTHGVWGSKDSVWGPRSWRRSPIRLLIASLHAFPIFAAAVSDLGRWYGSRMRFLRPGLRAKFARRRPGACFSLRSQQRCHRRSLVSP